MERRLSPYHRLFPDAWPRWVVAAVPFALVGGMALIAEWLG